MAVYETTGKVLTSTPDKSSTQQVINQTNQNPAAPASSNSVYNIGVRQALNNMGVDNNRIGYNNGYVTVDGQNVIRPQYNQGGYSYTSQPYLNSINGQVNQLNQAYNLQNQVLNPNQNKNPYDQQINDVLAQLTQRLNNPTPYDVYGSPEYAAYQAQAQQQAQQGIRSAQESLGASGLGRSSILADRAQGVQNQANQYLETQVVPQLIAANQARQQQDLSNLGNLIGLLSGQQSTYDTRGQNQFNNAYTALDFLTNRDQQAVDNRRADAALTGYYQTPEQQQVISDLLNIKKQAETPGITAAQRTNLSAQADQLRNVLSQLGVDPSLYGANVSYNQAEQVRPGRTLQGQQLDAQQQETAFNQNLQNEQFAYQKARDAISDKQWQAQFDQNVRQYGLDYGLRELSQKNDEAYRQAQLAISQDDNARAWLQLDQQAQQAANAQPDYSGLSANQVLDNARKLFSAPAEAGSTQLVIPTDNATKEKIYQYVGGIGLPTGQDDQVMLSLGLTAQDIKNFDKKYGVNSGN